MRARIRVCRGRLFGAEVVLLLALMCPAVSAAGVRDDLPSPLYRHSLDQTIARIEQRDAPAQTTAQTDATGTNQVALLGITSSSTCLATIGCTCFACVTSGTTCSGATCGLPTCSGATCGLPTCSGTTCESTCDILECPKIHAIQVGTNKASVALMSSTAALYRLMLSTNLLTTNWFNVTEIEGNGGELWMDDTNNPPGGAFYRIKLELLP
ncbi:MAG: hypothetical protein WCK89_03315 [bacterium]